MKRLNSLKEKKKLSQSDFLTQKMDFFYTNKGFI